MITLEKLAEELNINQIDEIIGGTPKGGQNTWWDRITTFGGTSGVWDPFTSDTTGAPWN